MSWGSQGRPEKGFGAGEVYLGSPSPLLNPHGYHVEYHSAEFTRPSSMEE